MMNDGSDRGRVRIGLWVGIGLILSLSAIAQQRPDSSEHVLALFKGGSVTTLDVEALALANLRKPVLGNEQEYQEHFVERRGGLEKMTQELACVRLLAKLAREQGISLDATQELTLQIRWDKLLGRMYYQSQARQFMEEGRQKHLAQCRTYYEKHRDSLLRPQEWMYRFILVGKAIQEDVQISPEEKKAFRSQAQAVYKRCKAGEDFQALAKEYSANAEERRGVLLGPTTGEGQPPQVAEALRKLSTGEISAPVEVPFGYLILKCESYSPQRAKTFEEALPEIRKQVGRYLPTSDLARLDKAIHDEYQPSATHEQSLSRAPENANAIIVEGTKVVVTNQDIFRPDIAEMVKEMENSPSDLLSLAREIYWRKVYSYLAREHGFDQQPVAIRALELDREKMLYQVALEKIQEGVLFPGLENCAASPAECCQTILERSEYKFLGQ